MGKPTLSKYIQEKTSEHGSKNTPGPYITISREFGCSGNELADILCKKLSEIQPDKDWKVFKKELLAQLAKESGLSQEVIEKERKVKPGFFREIFRNMRQSYVPDAFEIRNKIMHMVKKVAFEGYAIIVGQGGAAATADSDNGISVRVEAPKEWRIVRVCRRDGLKKEQARIKMEDVEKARKYLRKAYAQQNPRVPAFNLVFDNSIFTSEQIAEQIICAMQVKGMIPTEK